MLVSHGVTIADIEADQVVGHRANRPSDARCAEENKVAPRLSNVCGCCSTFYIRTMNDAGGSSAHTHIRNTRRFANRVGLVRLTQRTSSCVPQSNTVERTNVNRGLGTCHTSRTPREHGLGIAYYTASRGAPHYAYVFHAMTTWGAPGCVHSSVWGDLTNLTRSQM
ncbi:hypothetical protein AcV7_009821 [Taiwanofungus camphoratus]|nr:hypothetical protein AcV7_009821 [Antrodia cinnamomea]